MIDDMLGAELITADPDGQLSLYMIKEPAFQTLIYLMFFSVFTVPTNPVIVKTMAIG